LFAKKDGDEPEIILAIDEGKGLKTQIEDIKKEFRTRP